MGSAFQHVVLSVGLVIRAREVTLLCFFLFGAVWSEAGIEYQNAIGCELDVNCPKRWAMYAVKAKAGRVEATMPGTADHQWFWDCRKVGDWKADEHCRTYEDINGLQEFLAFRCPEDYYMSGIQTTDLLPADVHNRVWSVRCCTQPGLCITDCCLSDYLNEFEGDIDHRADSGSYFVGIFSHLDGPKPPIEFGRRWKVGQCRFQRCSLNYYLAKYGHKKYVYY